MLNIALANKLMIRDKALVPNLSMVKFPLIGDCAEYKNDNRVK